MSRQITKIYYQITIFLDKNKMGITLGSKWQDEKQAIEYFEKLSKNYPMVVLRKEWECCNIDNNSLVVSMSSPEKVHCA